jgi:4-amino-4-deoxy-L-arabinose transferase-like glycosyltransferase
LWPAEKSANATRVLCVCAVVYLCFFAGLDSFGLIGPDEPRYASIARAMAETGDWVTPRLNGVPWFEKPPLYYWTAAVGFRLFSSPEVAARIPSSVFALGAILAVLWITKRIYGAPVARLAVWMLPTAIAMMGFAHAAATDMPFTACLTLTMVAAACLLLEESPAHQRAWAAGFGAALGLSVLAKGPVAVVLAGGSTALWAIATGNIRRSLRLFNSLAIGSFLLVALPWYVLCAIRNPGFLRVFLLEHNVERFLTNRYQHHQPFWFFLPILLIAVFPWTLLLIPALGDAWRGLRGGAWRQLPATFFSAWVVFPFVFFSASQSKLPGYILPVVPPLVLLVAVSLEWRCDEEPSVGLRWIAGVSFVLSLLGAAVLLLLRFFPQRLPLELTHGGSEGHWTLLALQAVAGSLLLQPALAKLYLGSLRDRPSPGDDLTPNLNRPLIGYALVVVVTYLFLNTLGPQISARSVAAQVQASRRGSTPVATYHLARAWQYGLEFYLHGPVPEWSPGTPRPTWIITDDAGRAQLAAQGWNVEPIEAGSPHATLFRVR